jgi:hypothetical protein
MLIRDMILSLYYWENKNIGNNHLAFLSNKIVCKFLHKPLKTNLAITGIKLSYITAYFIGSIHIHFFSH